MKRIVLLTIVFYLLVLTCTSAEIYRCKTPDGQLVMTDRKSELPADCQPVEGPTGSGSFNIVPSGTGNATESQPPVSEQKAGSEGQDVAPWQSDARALVEKYKDAVRRRYHEVHEVDRLHAMQEIGQLRQQKHIMLNDLAVSGLKPQEQEAIRKTLDEIPQE